MHCARRLIYRLGALCGGLLLAVTAVAAQAAPLDPDRVKNDDARAFPRGLYFHSSIPVERRRMLVEDLAWLAGAGPLADSDALADLLAIKRRPLSGAMLVAWLIERMVIVSANSLTSAGSNGYPVILSGARPDLGVLVFDARKQDEKLSENKANKESARRIYNEYAESVGASGIAGLRRESHVRPDFNWRTADMANEEIDGWRIDDRILIATENSYANPASSYAAIYLTEAFWRQNYSQMPRHRIMRLALLFHEARHLDSRHPGDIDGHFPCEEGAWPRATDRLWLGGVRSLKYRSYVGCNWHHASAYGIEATFVRAMSQNCPACTSLDLDNLKNHEVGLRSVVQFRLRTPARIPNLPALRGEAGWAGLSIATVPPQIYFTALAEWIDLSDRRDGEVFDKYVAGPRFFPPEREKWRQQVAALSGWIAGLDRQGFIDPEHSPSRWGKVVNDDPSKERRERPDPDEQNAVRWAMAAAKAGAEGFNLPLIWMPPCGKFGGGCGADVDTAPPQPAALPQPTPGWLGVTIAKLTAEAATNLGLHRQQGVAITKVEKNSPAEKIGFRAGGIILEVDGQGIIDVKDLSRAVAAAGAGADVVLVYRTPDDREGRFTMGYHKVTLAKRPAELAASVPAASGDTATQAPAGRWMHNGSVMELVAEGAVRKFRYAEPREGMKQQGVTPGTLLFEGKKYGDRYSGTAFIFSMRCGRSSYEVSGDVSADQRRVTMRGRVPRLNAKCKVTGHRDDELVFDYVDAAPAEAAAGKNSGAMPASNDSAAPQATASGWERYVNRRFQYQIDIPPDFSEIKASDNGDGGVSSSSNGTAELRVWGGHLSEDGFAAEIEWRVNQDSDDGWSVTYQKQQAKWAVWSGAKGARIFYERAIPVCNGAAAYFRLEYDKSRAKAFDPIISRLATSLQSGDC